jgi:hypothetical protein
VPGRFDRVVNYAKICIARKMLGIGGCSVVFAPLLAVPFSLIREADYVVPQCYEFRYNQLI